MIELNGFEIAGLMIFTILGWEHKGVVSFVSRLFKYIVTRVFN